jgi:hypothetical protein
MPKRRNSTAESWSREQLAKLDYCHLCDCIIGWPHDATPLTRTDYLPHEPFLEDECVSCWASLAHTAELRPGR